MAKDKHPGGRPPKFTEESKRQSLEMAKLGLTDVAISKVLGISRSTFSKWKADNPEFSDIVFKSKDEPTKDVARMLLNRALGKCKVKETKVVKRLGKESLEMEDFEEVTVIKELPPDVGAINTYLTNRDSKNWKNKQEINSQIEVTEIKLTKKERLDRIAELQSKLGKGE